jgi:glutathione S-transferase
MVRRLLQFRRSPNSIKVRIALNFKGLEYEATEMMAAERAPMIEAAGWPLVPILLDGDIAMRDSAAILHYLEANYRDHPSLTPTEYDDLRSAEKIVTVLGPEIVAIRASLNAEIGKPEEERNPETAARARLAIVAALGRLEERLSKRDWLVGDAMSMYDVILACELLPTRAPAEFVSQSPLWRYLDANLRIEDERPIVSAWVGRVAAHDGLA